MSQLFSKISLKTKTSLGLAALLLSFMPGCAMDADEPSTSADTVEETPSDDPSFDDWSFGDESETTRDVVPFAQFIPQTVPWFDVDVTVESAASGSEVIESTWSDDVENGHAITLTVQNRTHFATGIPDQHWDLILADGTRVAGKTSHLDFGPRDALAIELWFEDESSPTLEGAHLELNGDVYGEFRPLLIPLDALVDSEPVLELPQIVGQSVPAPPVNDALWQHEVVSAQVSYNWDRYNGYKSARAHFGKKLLGLVVRSTIIGSSSHQNLFAGRFHLSVNGLGVSPDSRVQELPDPNAPVEVPVVFQIDEDVTEFDVEFAVGPSGSPQWETLHVDLADAVPAE